jgi:uncharacterized protein (TIGR02246 family)
VKLLGVGVFLLSLAAISTCAAISPPTPDDAALIRAVLERYRSSWLANDPNGVRSCFAEDAVLLPHHGVNPVVGMKAITDFWFAPSNAKTTVLKFERTVDEIGGDGSISYARGRSEVVWRIEDKGTTQEWRTHGSYMAILKKQADGSWLISHMVWDDVPNERTK